MKWTLLCQLRVKRVLPFALEINRVGQNQIRVSGINHAIRDASNASVRLVARPLVDIRFRRLHIAKIQWLDGGRKNVLGRREKAGFDLRALPIPKRIGRGENNVCLLYTSDAADDLLC